MLSTKFLGLRFARQFLKSRIHLAATALSSSSWRSENDDYAQRWGWVTKHYLQNVDDKVLFYLDCVPVKTNVFTIADYGTRDGYAVGRLLTKMIRMLQMSHGSQIQFQLIFEDMEENDYNILLKNVYDWKTHNAFYNVFPLATNINFYQQCIPDGHCDVILSFFACHWLRDTGSIMKHNVFHATAASEEEQKLFQKKASEDWETFLMLRAKELKQGGLLVVVTAIADENYRSYLPLVETNAAFHAISCQDIYILLEESWQDLFKRTVITKEEFQRCSSLFCLRTPSEVIAPFMNENSQVSKMGLTLLAHEYRVHACPFKTKWQHTLEQGGIDDRKTFAEEITQGNRTHSNAAFYNSLSNERSLTEKQSIIDDLYKTFQTKVEKHHPANFRSEVIISALYVQKRCF